MSQKIDGIEGALEILHGQVVDDIRITVHSQDGNKFYFPTKSAGAQKWIEAISTPVGRQPYPIHDGRIVIKFTIRGDDTVEIFARDVLVPGTGVKAVFNRDQIEKIKTALNSK